MAAIRLGLDSSSPYSLIRHFCVADLLYIVSDYDYSRLFQFVQTYIHATSRFTN